MSRRADRSYAGAAGKVITLADARQLGGAYALAPKLDGIFSKKWNVPMLEGS